MKIRVLDGIIGTLPDGKEFVWNVGEEHDAPDEFVAPFLTGDHPSVEPVAARTAAAKRETRAAA